MSGNSQPSIDNAAPSIPPTCPDALRVSIDGKSDRYYPLRRDKPTWIGRHPHGSFPDYNYIHLPASMLRYHCKFEWDSNSERFWVATGGRGNIWLNKEAVGCDERRPLNEYDVVIIISQTAHPYPVRLTVVRMPVGAPCTPL